MTTSVQENRANQDAASAANAVIVTQNLQRSYPMGTSVVHALSGVDVTIRKGEYVAIYPMLRKRIGTFL